MGYLSIGAQLFQGRPQDFEWRMPEIDKFDFHFRYNPRNSKILQLEDCHFNEFDLFEMAEGNRLMLPVYAYVLKARCAAGENFFLH